MGDQSQMTDNGGKKSKTHLIIAIVLIIAAALLVCVFLLGRKGIIDIPFLNKTSATGDASTGTRSDSSDYEDDGAEAVDQEPKKIRDYSNYAKNISQSKAAEASTKEDTSDDEGEEDEESDYSGEDYIFPDSSDKEISKPDIENLSNEDLRIAINEIYARHGYTFPNNEEMRNYFQGQDWYEADPDMDDQKKVKMSKTEKKNLDKMASERQKRKDDGDWPY